MLIIVYTHVFVFFIQETLIHCLLRFHSRFSCLSQLKSSEILKVFSDGSHLKSGSVQGVLLCFLNASSRSKLSAHWMHVTSFSPVDNPFSVCSELFPHWTLIEVSSRVCVSSRALRLAMNKPLATTVAFKRCVLCISSFRLSEILFPTNNSATLGAGIRLLTYACSFMRLEISWTSKTHTTLVACKRLLPCMCSFVLTEMPKLTKTLASVVASKRFLSCVGSFML